MCVLAYLSYLSHIKSATYFCLFFLILTLILKQFWSKVKKVIKYALIVGVSGGGVPTLLHTLWLPLVEARRANYVDDVFS